MMPTVAAITLLNCNRRHLSPKIRVNTSLKRQQGQACKAANFDALANFITRLAHAAWAQHGGHPLKSCCQVLRNQFSNKPKKPPHRQSVGKAALVISLFPYTLHDFPHTIKMLSPYSANTLLSTEHTA